MTPRDWSASGGIKIKRAKEHFRNLQAELHAFSKRNPYSAVGEEDPETGDWVTRAVVHEFPDPRWGAITGDVIHNLRATLDHLWGRAMKPGGGRCDEGFPFYSSAEKLEDEVLRAVKRRRKTAMNLLQAIKPYPGGNDLLCLLDALDNIDKHEVLIPAYGAVPFVFIDAVTGLRTLKPDLKPHWLRLDLAEPICPVENGTELDRIPASQRGKVNMNTQIPLTISFGEFEVVKGKPILPLLHQMIEMVDGIEKDFITARLLA
jgi:hypothetical protein